MPLRKSECAEGDSGKRNKLKKPQFDVVSLREIVAGIKPEKAIRERADGSHKKEPTIQLSPSGRRCICCDAPLSRYNSNKLCWPCDKAIAEWKNFPMNRSELEKTMAKHCLNYVREHYSGKKRASNAVGGEVSSGSFARAVGRKKR